MIVVDVGCAPRAGEESVHKLINRFQPVSLFGFDPGARPTSYTWHGCLVTISDEAAWTKDGHVFWRERGNDGIESMADEKLGERLVDCFSLSTFLRRLDRVILKIDAEGAEYVLIPDLIKTGAINRVERLLVEWHGDPIEGLPCPVELW